MSVQSQSACLRTHTLPTLAIMTTILIPTQCKYAQNPLKCERRCEQNSSPTGARAWRAPTRTSARHPAIPEHAQATSTLPRNLAVPSKLQPPASQPPAVPILDDQPHPLTWPVAAGSMGGKRSWRPEQQLPHACQRACPGEKPQQQRGCQSGDGSRPRLRGGQGRGPRQGATQPQACSGPGRAGRWT